LKKKCEAEKRKVVCRNEVEGNIKGGPREENLSFVSIVSREAIVLSNVQPFCKSVNCESRNG